MHQPTTPVITSRELAECRAQQAAALAELRHAFRRWLGETPSREDLDLLRAALSEYVLTASFLERFES